MRHFSLVVLASLCSSLAARQELLLVLDQTLCWNCSDAGGELSVEVTGSNMTLSGCREEVGGAAQTLRAVNWTLERLDQLDLVARETYSE